MCSPTIMRELTAIKRYHAYADQRAYDSFHYGTLDPSRVLVAEMPERRYHEAHEREEQAFIAAGNRSVCDACGKRAVKHDTACTYGYAGHPGADYTVIRTCEECGNVEM